MFETRRQRRGLELFDQAVARNSNAVEILHDRGVALHGLQRFDEAFAAFDQVLALNPRHAEALINRGNALQALRRFEDAVTSYDKALTIRPDFAQAHYNRGNALRRLDRLNEALACYDRALAIKPHFLEALNNRSAALQRLNRFDEALAASDEAIALKPDCVEAFFNRGNALVDMNRSEEALASYDRALALRPDYADATFHRGITALLRGDFATGWRGYESRWSRANAPARRVTAPIPVWAGENISGRKILVYAEQSSGDIIQFARYLTLLAAAGAHVTFLAPLRLARLLQSLGPTVRVMTAYPTGESFDYQSALMSLPFAFGTTVENIPRQTPYLRAEPDRMRRWKSRLGDHGFKIGIAWRGSDASIRSGRSFALSEYRAISEIPNVRLISLQYNLGAEQLCDAPTGMAVETLGDDFDAGDDAFLDTAAVMENLDLVISPDTSIAHLAGALNRPIWLALPYSAEWRWLLDRFDSPWYPSMQLFRQHHRGDWRDVFSDMAAELLPSARRVRDLAF